MKREKELLRGILLKLEDWPTIGEPLTATELEFGKYDEAQVNYHCQLLIDVGYVKGTVVPATAESPEKIILSGITFHGHDFLDGIRDDASWGAAVKKLEKTEMFSASLFIDLAKEYVKSLIGSFSGM